MKIFLLIVFIILGILIDGDYLRMKRRQWEMLEIVAGVILIVAPLLMIYLSTHT